MIATIGDLIDDVVVRPIAPIRPGTDTESHIEHRRGGSAANVAATAARIGAAARFVGQVGDDAIGRHLVDELAAVGVDVSHVRFGGSTGTIVVLVDDDGERTMLVDRRSTVALDAVEPAALDGVEALHVPLYGVAAGALAATVAALVAEAQRRDVRVSVDLSSVALLDGLGREAVASWLDRLAPHLVFANTDEARWLDLAPPSAITIEKRGPAPAVVSVPGSDRCEVPAQRVDVVDSTGAGDAFAAGYLVAGRRADPADACRAGHLAAATLLRSRAPTRSDVVSDLVSDTRSST